jgi:hypothetical protein
MALVTKQFRSSLARTIDGWEATDYFQVSGVSSREEAIESAGVPQIGDSHPFNSFLTCGNVQCSEGPSIYQVVAVYSTLFSQLPDPTGDPLSQEPQIVYRQQVEYLEADRDIDYNPILNTAGDVLSPAGQYPIIVERISIARNEPFYDRARAFEYIDAVNGDAVTFLGATFPAGTLRCLGIAPSEAFTTDAEYLTIVYDFEARNNPASNPHQLWTRMTGRAGWYDDSGDIKRGAFCYESGDLVTSDVLLKLDGTPFDATVKVLAADGETVALPQPAPASATAGVTPLETNEGQSQTLVCFKTRTTKTFTGLI